jgi:hypothetical protein
MTFVFDVVILYVDNVVTPQNMINYSIMRSLSDNQTTLELLGHFWKITNEFLAHDHPLQIIQ